MEKLELNENCLDGMRCPKCGSFGPFELGGVGLFIVNDDGVQGTQEPDWTAPGTRCRCQVCGYGAVREKYEIVPLVGSGDKCAPKFSEKSVLELIANAFIKGDSVRRLASLVVECIERDGTKLPCCHVEFAEKLQQAVADIRSRERPQVKIDVSGGNVDDVVSNVELDYLLVDWDNIKECGCRELPGNSGIDLCDAAVLPGLNLEREKLAIEEDESRKAEVRAHAVDVRRITKAAEEADAMEVEVRTLDELASDMETGTK